MLDVRDLECLAMLAEELHFGRAAGRLSLAQPALTKRIQRIERDLQIEIFERTSAGVRITAAGAEIVERARDMLGSWTALRLTAGELASGRRGEVRIGAVGSAFYEALPTLLTRARRELPEARLLVEEMETPALVEALRTGEVQLGFVRPPVGEGLTMQTVWVEPLVVALPDDDPLAQQERVSVAHTAERPFIFFPREAGTGYWDRVSALHVDAGIPFAPRVSATHVVTILGQVALGAGVSVVPASASRLAIPGVAYRPLTETSVLPLAVASRPRALSAVARRVWNLMPTEPIVRRP